MTDSPCIEINDSCYDNLVNELNEDVDASHSEVIKKLGQGTGSMDSVLTLCDYDLEKPEVESLLTLSYLLLDHLKYKDIEMELDFDRHEHEDIQMEQRRPS